jgi:hypothetical protein
LKYAYVVFLPIGEKTRGTAVYVAIPSALAPLGRSRRGCGCYTARGPEPKDLQVLSLWSQGRAATAGVLLLGGDQLLGAEWESRRRRNVSRRKLSLGSFAQHTSRKADMETILKVAYPETLPGTDFMIFKIIEKFGEKDWRFLFKILLVFAKFGS